MKRLFALALLFSAFSLTSMALAQDATPAVDAKTPDEICQSASTAEPETRTFTKPEQVLQPDTDYRAVFCTDAGPIYIDLLEDYSPIAVNSFVFLAQKGYFNNTTFHRVIQDFMAQGGDPTAKGTGGPGYEFGVENSGFLHFDKPGWLAMANSGQPNSNGSQFFITTAAYPSLDFNYTIFGEVLEGQENAGKIKLRDPDTATEPGTTLKTVAIVTDPATVKSSYEAPKPATEDEVVAAFKTVDQQIPADSGIKDEQTTATTEQVIAAAPESIRTKYGDFLAAHNHQYRVSSSISACNLEQVPFMSMSYTLDAFASADDAAAALKDPVLDDLQAANGLTTKSTPTTLTHTMYTKTTSACSDTPAVQAVTYWQRGRFLITAEIVMPSSGNVTPDARLANFVGILYEFSISDVLRRELR